MKKFTKKCKEVHKKSKMLFVIYTISVFLFALAYNMCFHRSFQPDKVCVFLSDFYSAIYFKEDKPMIKELNQWEKDIECQYLMPVFSYSQGKAAEFTEKFLRDLGVSGDVLKGEEQSGDIALVNRDGLALCYEMNGKLYLKVQGIRYRVIAQYEDVKDDGLQETFYFINRNAKSLQEKTGYDYVILDSPSDGGKAEKSFQQKFREVSVKHWQGTLENTMDNRPFFVMVTVFCGVLLSLNCIGFSHEWMKPLHGECGIRKMLGAREWQNHWLIFKRFLGLFFCSFFCGNLLAFAFLFVLSHMQSLPSLRELMGSFLYWKSVLLAGLSVGSIGTVIIEWNIFWMSRRNILKNIRG